MASTSALLLLLLLPATSPCVMCANAAGDDELNYMVVAANKMKHIAEGAVCSGHKEMPSSNRTWLPLNRPRGACSSAPGRVSLLDDMLLWDQLHTNSIRMKLISRSSNSSEDYTPPIVVIDSRDGGPATTVDHKLEVPEELPNDHASQSLSPAKYDYQLAAAAKGKGKNKGSGGDQSSSSSSTVKQTVVIDTSSDVPWVQCSPCPAPQCHPQKDELYDPSRSSTYAPVPCGSPACRQLDSSGYGNGCSSSGQCQYMVNYGDGTATAGTYIIDTLTLTPTTVISNFRFGCSHAVRGSFSDQTAGTLALGGGSQSLLGQTAKLPGFGNAFSYCVPLPSSKGFLSLGGPNGASSAFSRTPLVRNARFPATFYIIRLQAITVAGRRINVPPAVFSAGAVVDSSTIVTQLPPTAYRALRTAFRNTMSMYPLTNPTRNLDTCYDFTRFPRVTVPKISLIFDRGATLQLNDPTSIMIDGCLAFAATANDRAIGFIGNVQQQTYEVLYDIGATSVGFRPNAC